jgi:UDP-N-acetylmuramoylalanine--D-glutamate ligase
VLLSPACASFDMFDNFEHRGDVFKKLVGRLD